MKLRMPVRKLAAAAGVLIAMPGAAETLEQAWNTALEQHALIAAAEEQREAAFRELDASRSERMPSIELSSGITRFDTAPSLAFGGFSSPPLFDNDTMIMSQAQVSLPLYAGGVLVQGIAAARATADASEQQLDALQRDVKLAVAEAYLDVLRAGSALGVAESNVATLAAHQQDAENRYQSGAVPRNDYLSATVALADARQRQLQAANALRLAESAYNRVLGRDLLAPVDLSPDIPLEGIVPQSQDLPSLTERALSGRPELGAFDAQATALRAQSSAVRGASRPRLALMSGYQRLENQVLDEEGFWTIGIGFEWNLFDSGRQANRAAALERRADALAYRRADLETAIGLEIRQALLARTEAESRLAVAEQAVEQAAENLSVVQDRYASGAGTNADVLDAEALRTLSLNNRDSATYDIKLALVRLAHALGSL